MLVHDAARPCLTQAELARLIDEVGSDDSGGLLAVPVTDTLKRAEDGRAAETLDRNAVWCAQTPQMFRYASLRAAMSAGSLVGITDEASAIERNGIFPRLVLGSTTNIKVTTEQDLTLSDQDRVTTGLYFSPGADRVALMFALDQSGSLRQIIAQQQEAALALFSRFGERSSVAILRFSDTASLVAPFTKDLDAARAAFRFTAAPNQQTAIFDAAARAVKSFDDLKPVRSERRIVVLISDGLDTRSRTSAEYVINAALERRVSFYVIHLPLFEPRDGRLEVRRPSKGFKELAEKTGGKYFLVGDAKSALMPRENDLTPIFQAIEEDLKSQYLLGFYISESSRDNRKHVFSVSMKSQGMEYSVGGKGYSPTHKFMNNRPPGAKN
jgi:VWFA-related protein